LASLLVTENMNLATFALSSGRPCSISHVQTLWLRNYYVFTCDGDATLYELPELLALALSEAQRLASEKVGDSGRYTLIFSGPKSRRRRGSHVHILLSTSRVQKAWLYFVLASKNLLQAVGLRRS
jgi:hypothetical protein